MAASVTNLKRVSGSLALDFANSIDWRLSEQPHDWLTEYDSLLTWARATGCIKPAERTALSKLAQSTACLASQVFDRAIELREAIYCISRAVVSGGKPDKGDLATLNARLVECPPRSNLRYARSSFYWHMPERDLTTPIWPIAWAAADILVGQDRELIKICASEDCGWLFVDRSRNFSRRWCSMSDCGNRDKARRFYARSKGGEDLKA